MRIIFLLLGIFIPFHALAVSMDVVADAPSGVYHAPIQITLTPSDPLAKTFYSFKPDGTPNDAFLYTGTILLKHSTPFIYFSFLTPDNESKIKQNDYIFEYSNSIELSSDNVSGSGNIEIALVNRGPEMIDVGWWHVQSSIDNITIPEGTTLVSGGKYVLKIQYSGIGSIILYSPDDEEKNILVTKADRESSVAPKKSVNTKIIPRKIISTRNDSDINIIPAPVVSTIQKDTTSSDIPLKDIAIQPPIPAPQVDINQMVKVSALEANSQNLNPLYLLGLLILSFVAGGIQWYIKKKQK